MSRFLPQRYGVPREQATLLKAQGHLYKGTRQKVFLRQNTTMSINLFGFSTFYVFLDFWHKNKKRLIKNSNVKTFKAKAKRQKIFNSNKQQHTTKYSHKTLEVLMHGHVVMLMQEYPSSPTHHLRLGWYPYRIGYKS